MGLLRLVKKLLKLTLLLFILFFIFFAVLVLPTLYRYYRLPELSKKGKPYRIAFDLIDSLGEAGCRKSEGWVRKDPYRSGCQVSLGKFLWMVESRRAIPAKGKISFSFKPEKGSYLVLGAGVGEKECHFRVSIDREDVLNFFMKPAPQKQGWFFQKFGKFLYIKFFPQKGYWEDFRIPLERWAGREVNFVLEASCGYWSSPKIISPADSAPPNLLMIQIDALRADLIGKGILPNLDRLAAEGFWFRRAISGGNWTRSSNLIQFYSKYNSHLGISPEDFYIHPLEKEIFYRRAFPSIASYLAEKGYAVKAIGNNVFIHGFSEWGLDIGFEEVKDFEKLRYESAYIVEEALRWIELHRGVPFFLFLDFNQAHFPYKPPLTAVPIFHLLSRPTFALYEGCARMVDYYLGELLDKLSGAGYLENTLLVINSDHGECFAVRGKPKRSYYAENKPIEPHGQTLTNEEIFVPLIFYWKGHIPARASDFPASNLDVSPTALKLLGFHPPSPWEGKDLSPMILRNEKIPPTPVFLEGRNEFGVIEGKWKMIIHMLGTMDDRLVLLEKEGENLVEKYPERARKMRALIEKNFSYQQPVVIVRFSVEKGTVRIKPSDNINLLGGRGKIKLSGPEEVKVEGKGFIYIIPHDLGKLKLEFEGGRVRIYPSGIPLDESTVSFSAENVRIFWFPFKISRFIPRGFSVGVMPLLSFAKTETFNPHRKATGMEQILIEWGYMKK